MRLLLGTLFTLAIAAIVVLVLGVVLFGAMKFNLASGVTSVHNIAAQSRT